MIQVKIVTIGMDALDRFPQLATPSIRFQIARDIMEGARGFVIKKASEVLHSTRADYINGLQPVTREGKSVVLALVGVLPNMIENGWTERFLHETLLSDSAKGWKTSAEGYRYRAIPFRHKTPGAGPQGGQPMGSQYGANKNPASLAAGHAIVADTKALGKAVYKAAKKLTPGMGMASKVGGAPLLRTHHTVDIFAGMIVNKQAVQKSGAPKGQVSHQRSYTTFRMISEARPDAWYHPGIQARDILDQVDGYIQKVAPKAVESFMAALLGGSK